MTIWGKKKKLLISFTSACKENAHQRLKQAFKHSCDSSTKKTRSSASSFLLLEISQISSSDLHASCRLSSLRTGTWSVGRGSLRLCWETSSWHNEKKLTPKDSISLAFCELTSHSCLWVLPFLLVMSAELGFSLLLCPTHLICVTKWYKMAVQGAKVSWCPFVIYRCSPSQEQNPC